MKKETAEMLVGKAIEARKKSYCPYSNFAVGAALLTTDGRVYTGANIESVSFSPTVCAERVAFFTAVHAGERDFSAIAVVGGKADQDVNDFCPPCGVCRQVMTEFCKRDFTVLLSDGKNIKEFTLDAILPESFSSVD